MNIARDMKMVFFCLALFGTLPVFAAEPGDIPEATARLLTSGDPQLVKFGEQSLRVEQLNSPKAKTRLEAELSRYLVFKEQGLPLFEALSAGVLDDAQGEQLRNLILETTPPEPPIYGATTLPYQNLGAAQRLPVEEPDLTPAYVSGSTSVTDADRQASPTAPISQAIVSKARELNWNPASIYDYVYNYVDTEWYHGCMKGAEETLSQGSGNDCDQAALLVSLLRASGYPARFVVGVGRFLEWERVPTLLGVSDVAQVSTLLRRAGIPYVEERTGGKLSNIRFEHVWVEAYVPYTNYRGSVADEAGELWLPLDTSLKAAGHVLSQPPELPEGLDLAAVANNYLQADRPETPLEFLKTEIEVALDAVGSELAYEDLLLSCTLRSQHLDILPAGLPFVPVHVTGESASVPERLLHRVSLKVFDALDPNRVFCTLDLPAFKFSNRSIAVRYEPETVEDQEIINAYGGLGQTPAYLVRLRPVITVDGERLAVGSEGLPMGADARLSVELISPANQKSFINELVVGNLTVMALVSGKPVFGETKALENKGAEEIYFDEGLMYLARWQSAERELASLLRLKLLHPAPQLVTLGGVIEVTRLLGSPQEFTWKGAFVDADLRQVELVGAPINRYRFMELSGLQGSVLEDRVLREDLGVESISTARFLAIANNQGIPLVILNSGNVDSVLPGLPFGAKVKNDIRDAVQQGQEVLVTESMLTLDAWTGVGYLRRDPVTGEAGWMLSGSIAGAYTVVDRASWPGPFFTILAHQLVSAPNYDSLSARSIAKVLATDGKQATVGETIELKVVVVDVDRKPVDGAQVSFSLLAGGGSLDLATVTTNPAGIATASLTLGTKTSSNPVYLPGDPWTVQAGLNVVDAYLTNSSTHLRGPLTAIGLPDKSSARLIDQSGTALWGRVMSWAGCPDMIVLDQYDNPVSNVSIDVWSVQPTMTDGGEPMDPRPGLIIDTKDSCVGARPTYDEALLACSGGDFEYLRIKSSITRATFCTILSGSPGAHYTFNVLAGADDSGGPNTSDSLLTYDFEAYYNFLQSDIGLCNMGESIESHCVGKAGSTVDLLVRQHFMVRNAENQGEERNFCENPPYYCPVLSAMPGYFTTRQFEDRLILAAPTGDPEALAPVEYRPNGESVLHLAMPSAPGSYEYDWSSMGSTMVEHWWGDCDQCYAQSLPCSVYFHPSTSSQTPQHEKFTCHSVGIEFLNGPYSFNLDEYGYTTSDNVIEFQILPESYEPEIPVLEVFFENGGEEVPVFYSSISTGHNSVTIGRGTFFDREKNYYARIILNSSMNSEIRSDEIELQTYSAMMNLVAFRPGTMAEPGEEVSEIDEDDPEKLVMYVNSNRQYGTEIRDFHDDIIDPWDKDIVKLVLGQYLDVMPEGGRIGFTLEPSQLYKIYNVDGIKLDNFLLSDLSAPIDNTLSILEHDVTLYIESLGPVYGAEGKLSIFDSYGDVVASDSVLLSAVFHLENLHEAVVGSALLAYTCGGVDGDTVGVEECENSKSKWTFTPNKYISIYWGSDENRYWKNTFYDNGYSNANFLVLKENASAYLGVMELFENYRQYGFECYNAVLAIQNRAIITLLSRCNLENGYICNFSSDVSTYEEAYNCLFSGKRLAFAGPNTNTIGGNFANLNFVNNLDVDEIGYGNWIYLRNPSKILEATGNAHQGVNLLVASAMGCEICGTGRERYSFLGYEHCVFDMESTLDGVKTFSDCMRTNKMYGHDSGLKSFELWAKDHYDFNESNQWVELQEPKKLGVLIGERRVDLLDLSRKVFEYDRSSK